MAYKLKSKYKKAWLKALRSGEYKQCQQKLTDGAGGYCCLGVLVEVTAGMEGTTRELYRQDENSALPNDVLRNTVFRDTALRKRYIRTNTWDVRVKEQHPVDGTTGPGRTTLYGLNDCECYSFEQIADVIEKYF